MQVFGVFSKESLLLYSNNEDELGCLIVKYSFLESSFHFSFAEFDFTKFNDQLKFSPKH